MTELRTSGLRTLAMCGLIALVAACNTTPQRTPPPPKPIDVSEPPPPPPPPQQRARREQSSEQSTTTAGGFAPPSDNAAEVEVEEIPLDGGESMAELPDESAGAAQTQDGNKRAGGGSSLPPPVMVEITDEKDDDDAGGVVQLNAEPAAVDPAMVGPDMRIGAQTDDEQVAKLDGELNSQLSAFDERMRRARAAANSEREVLATANAGAPDGQIEGRGYRREQPPDIRGAGGAAASGTGLGNSPDLSGTNRAARGQIAVYAPPAGIADGGDDDIVARQLREAASKENDPVLREKLWEEYRKYKAGL